MAAPAVAIHVRYNPNHDRVVMNVTDHRQKVLLGIDQNRLVAPPEWGTVSVMAPVEPLSVDPIEVSHRPGESCLRGLKQQVVVVVHQTVGIDLYLPQP